VSRRLTLIGAALAFSAAPGMAQQPAAAEERRIVEGRVLRGGSDRERAVAGQTVVLHRIAADGAGPLDSMRTSRDGRYRFTYRATGSEAMYIVSARYAGVAYFTPPLRAAVTRGDDAMILVFDTTSARVPLQVRGRHLVITAPGSDGTRRVVDVFEIANDSVVTKVAGAGGATWSTPLPAGARGAVVGRGDVSAEAVRFAGDTARVIAPFAPGFKQLVLRYELSGGAFPLRLPLADEVTVLEVLLEEASARVVAPGLARQDAVSLEGRQYQRYLAERVPAGAIVDVAVDAAPSRRFGGVAVGVLFAAAAALALGTVAGRRAAPAAAWLTASDDTTTPDALAAAIAALDNVMDGSARAGTAARDTYSARRAELKARLTAALARARASR
jgi:hypothetical protein